MADDILVDREWIRKQANRIAPDFDQDDMVQEGLIAAWQANTTFKVGDRAAYQATAIINRIYHLTVREDWTGRPSAGYGGSVKAEPFSSLMRVDEYGHDRWIGREPTDDSEARFREVEDRLTVQTLLGLLDERSRFVIELLYGLRGDEKSKTEVGNIVGVTRQRVDQIHDQAINTMREGAEEGTY